jgi:hypothetical protein
MEVLPMPKRNAIRKVCAIHLVEKRKVRWGVGFDGGQIWKFICPECERLKMKRHKNHPSKRAWNKANKVKKAAHKLVENALLRGDLVRMPCCRCGSGDSHAHHDDYDKPLEVMWLCPLHHKERHREIE